MVIFTWFWIQNVGISIWDQFCSNGYFKNFDSISILGISDPKWRNLNLGPILCKWVFQIFDSISILGILDPKWRKLNLGPILCKWVTLTWLVCQKGLTFFKSPRNVLPWLAPLGPSLARRFGDFDQRNVLSKALTHFFQKFGSLAPQDANVAEQCQSIIIKRGISFSHCLCWRRS